MENEHDDFCSELNGDLENHRGPRGPISFMKRLGLPHGYDSQFAMVKDPPFLSSVNLFFYGPFPMAMLNNQRV